MFIWIYLLHWLLWVLQFEMKRFQVLIKRKRQVYDPMSGKRKSFPLSLTASCSFISFTWAHPAWTKLIMCSSSSSLGTFHPKLWLCLFLAESASLACLGWQRAGLGLLNDLSSCSIDDPNDANVPTYQAVNV